MHECRLVALDLDGTLFHTNHQLSKRTLKTMHKVVDDGHSIVIVTGRSAHSAVPRLELMPRGISLICSNGAYEFDRENFKITRATTLGGDTTRYIQSRILAELPTASFGWESISGLAYEPKFAHEAGGIHTLEQGGTHDASLCSDTLKVFVRTPELKHAKLATKIKQILGNDVEVSSSGVPFVEITAAGVNKGSALKQVASDLGFTAEQTIAFGDNQNDIPMFHWAAEAVAMGNAIPELKQIANAITLDNSQDGVAQYLDEKLGLTDTTNSRY